MPCPLTAKHCSVDIPECAQEPGTSVFMAASAVKSVHYCFQSVIVDGQITMQMPVIFQVLKAYACTCNLDNSLMVFIDEHYGRMPDAFVSRDKI